MFEVSFLEPDFERVRRALRCYDNSTCMYRAMADEPPPPTPQVQVINDGVSDIVHVFISESDPLLVTDDVKFKFFCSTVSCTTPPSNGRQL